MKSGTAALPPMALDAIDRSLMQRGLPATRMRWKPNTAGRSAEEMAPIVAFLGSDDASYISGHALVADGGYGQGCDAHGRRTRSIPDLIVLGF